MLEAVSQQAGLGERSQTPDLSWTGTTVLHSAVHFQLAQEIIQGCNSEPCKYAFADLLCYLFEKYLCLCVYGFTDAEQ